MLFLLTSVFINLFYLQNQKWQQSDAVTPASQTSVVNVSKFGALPVTNKNETKYIKQQRWLAVKNAFEYCIKNRADLYFPPGTYDVGDRNFPFRVAESESDRLMLLDCRGITIFGGGRGTVLKTSSERGADVLQLNFLKNIRIKGFDITATLLSNRGSGSNGISITGGFENVSLEDIYVFDMPGVDKGDYVDGAKGLTVQLVPNSKLVAATNLSAKKISIKNCAYGFRFDGAHISDVVKRNVIMDIDLSVENAYQGFSMDFGNATETVNATKKLNIKVTALLKNCQQYVRFSRVIGGQYNFMVSKTNNFNNNGKWQKNDRNSFAFLSNYSKHVNLKMTGNVGNVDRKFWIGAVGSIKEPFNLKNSTEFSTFNFDVAGSSSIEDFSVISYEGASINNSEFNISSSKSNVGTKIDKSNKIKFNK